MQYSDEVSRHFEQPHNGGRPDWPADRHGEAGSEESGLKVHFWLALEGNTIRHAAWAVFGCPHAIATASWVAQNIEGRPLAEACRLDLQTVVAALDLPAEKWRCVLVAEDALAACANEDR